MGPQRRESGTGERGPGGSQRSSEVIPGRGTPCMQKVQDWPGGGCGSVMLLRVAAGTEPWWGELASGSWGTQCHVWTDLPCHNKDPPESAVPTAGTVEDVGRAG